MQKQNLEQQFTTLYNTEADAIFRYCFIRTSKRDVAVDIMQDTFMRLWNSLGKEQEIKNMRAFLFTVARNLIIDWYRKKKADSLDALLEAEGGDAFLSSHANPETEIEMESEGRYLIGKIRELDPSYQQVVYLRFVEGMKPKEIADILGESVNAVSVRITRGVEKLRQISGYSDITT